LQIEFLHKMNQIRDRPGLMIEGSPPFFWTLLDLCQWKLEFEDFLGVLLHLGFRCHQIHLEASCQVESLLNMRLLPFDQFLTLIHRLHLLLLGYILLQPLSYCALNSN
jgi:hypothetical protein